MNHPILYFFVLTTIAGTSFVHASPSGHLAARAVVAATGEVLEKGAREAAEHAAAAAIKRLGIEGAEQAARRGGLALLHAGARHGDAIWDLARRVPEASRYLASHPDDALALADRYGDEAVRLESRLPGVARDAGQLFGRDRLATLTQANPVEVGTLVSFAKHADSAATRDALFEMWRRRGGSVLKELDKHKILILTTGLTLGTVKVADGAEDALRAIPAEVPEAVETMASKTGEALKTLTGKTGTGLMLGLIICGFGIVLIAGFRLWLHRPQSKT